MDASTGPRCARCGAGAKHLYTRDTLELEWCNHHARQHHTALMAAGFEHYELAVPDVQHVGASAVHG